MMKFVLGALIFTAVFMSLNESLAAGGGGKGAHRDNTTLFPPQKPDLSKGTAPSPVKLLEPAFMSTANASVTLKWEASAEAEAYHVQVATDPNFKWLVTNELFVKGTSFDVSGLEADKHYYWRVAGWKSGQAAGASKGDFVKSMFKTH